MTSYLSFLFPLLFFSSPTHTLRERDRERERENFRRLRQFVTGFFLSSDVAFSSSSQKALNKTLPPPSLSLFLSPLSSLLFSIERERGSGGRSLLVRFLLSLSLSLQSFAGRGPDAYRAWQSDAEISLQKLLLHNWRKSL